MAQSPYNPVPDVAPRVTAPDDLEHIQASPASFGGGIAKGLQQESQGEEKLGAAFAQTGHLFGQVAANNAWNQVNDAATKILKGDPSVMVTGPDGQQHPDTGYMGLEGKAALDARPGIEKKLDDLISGARGGLTTVDQQLEYDSISRRYRAFWSGDIGSHADRQAKTWYGEVNKTEAQQNLDGIAGNINNPERVAHFSQDLKHAYVKQAQLQGGAFDKDGNPDELIKGAMTSADKDAAAQIVKGLAATGDYKKAKDALENYKDKLGTEYVPLSHSIQEGYDRQSGVDMGAADFATSVANRPYANPQLPVYRDTTLQHPGGYSQAGLARTIQIESGGDPDAGKNSTHVGLGQFSDATWREVGATGDRTDPQQSIVATQKYAVANGQILKLGLGRDPTDAELYLAHQQGPFGALRLLQHPDAKAGDVVGAAAISQNGGDPNASSAAFTSMWVNRFTGVGTDWSTKSVKADALQSNIERFQRGEINYQQFAHAQQMINTLSASRQLAEVNDEKLRKDMVNNTADEYVQKIQVPGTNSAELVARITTDPRLKGDWKAREELINIARTHAGNDLAQASQTYGPGFWDQMKRIGLPTGDPNRLSDPTQLLSHVGENGDLTLAGMNKLWETMGRVTKSVNDNAVHTTSMGLMSYAKGQLSFESDTGPIKIRDPKGEAIFNSVFIPKFQSALDDWVKAGKSPWEFLTRENIDKMIAPLRDKNQMAMDRVSATGEATGDTADQTIPPAPQGIEPPRWLETMSVRPILGNNQPLPPQNWAAIIGILRATPTDKNKKHFNEDFPGFDADKILQKLSVGPVKETSAPPPKPLPNLNAGFSAPPAPEIQL